MLDLPMWLYLVLGFVAFLLLVLGLYLGSWLEEREWTSASRGQARIFVGGRGYWVIEDHDLEHKREFVSLVVFEDRDRKFRARIHELSAPSGGLFSWTESSHGPSDTQRKR